MELTKQQFVLKQEGEIIINNIKDCINKIELYGSFDLLDLDQLTKQYYRLDNLIKELKEFHKIFLNVSLN